MLVVAVLVAVLGRARAVVVAVAAVAAVPVVVRGIIAVVAGSTIVLAARVTIRSGSGHAAGAASSRLCISTRVPSMNPASASDSSSFSTLPW